MDPEQFYYYVMGFFERNYTPLTAEEQDILRERITLVRVPVTHKVTAPPDIMAPRKPCGGTDPDADPEEHAREVKRFGVSRSEMRELHPLFRQTDK